MANPAYITKSVAAALNDFDQEASSGNINDPLFRLACRLLELAHAEPTTYSEAEAEHDATSRALQLGHNQRSIADTWRSACKATAGKAANVPPPTAKQAAHGFANLADYAQSRGVSEAVFVAAGWSDAILYEHEYTDRKGQVQIGLADQQPTVYKRQRRALRFATDSGPRYRLIDEDKPTPKYWHRHGTITDKSKTWYRLAPALVIGAQLGYIALVNGEASTVVAQHFGIPAVCESGGGETLTPDHLLNLLKATWRGEIVIALDCDAKGRKSAEKKLKQYLQAGFRARAIDLQLGDREDIADFARIRGASAAADLLAQPDLPDPQAQAAQGQAAPQRTQSQAIIDELTNLGYTFRLNECGQTIEVNGQPISDMITAEIRTALRDATGRRQFGAVEDAWLVSAKANAYHPIKDYFANLVWDGQNRIAQLADCLIGNNPDVLYADGQRCNLVNVYLHRWLIGAVAKVLEQGQNGMIVFVGGQNQGKSTFSRWLCPPALRKRHYIEQAINPNDKDDHLRLMTTMIWEVAELDATTRKADVAALKHFISQRDITVRRAFGRYDTHGAAVTSLIGTVNSDEFLVDETGNRRFYVIDLQRLDWSYERLDIDQIWAEALARYRRGEPWKLTNEEYSMQTDNNRQFVAGGLILDYIKRYFWLTSDPNDLMTAAEIADHLTSKGVKLLGTDRGIANDIARAASALGLTKIRRDSRRCYVGIAIKP